MVATTTSICNSGSSWWPPPHQSATRDRDGGRHHVNLQLGIVMVATTMSICNSGSPWWPPPHQSATRDCHGGHHHVNLQLGIVMVDITISISDARPHPASSCPKIPHPHPEKAYPPPLHPPPGYWNSRISCTGFVCVFKIFLVICRIFCNTNANLHPNRPCSRYFPHPARYNATHRRVPAG